MWLFRSWVGSLNAMMAVAIIFLKLSNCLVGFGRPSGLSDLS